MDKLNSYLQKKVGHLTDPRLAKHKQWAEEREAQRQKEREAEEAQEQSTPDEP